MNEDLKIAAQIIKSGGTILYPTDTIWGIGCDATNPKAVEKIYRIKKRQESKSMLVLVDFPGRIERYVSEVPDIAWQLMEVTDKPLTLILPGARNLAANLVAEDNSIGMRVAGDEFCRLLISKINKPIVSTSANITGQSYPLNFGDIDDEIVTSVDYVVKWRQNEVGIGSPSGIIKVEVNGEIKVLRE